MRILFLITQDLESPYGVGRFMPLARELSKAGHNVGVMALHSNYSELKKRKFLKENIYVHYVGPMHVLKKGSTKEYYSTLKLVLISFWATLRLTQEVLKYDADIIHIGKPHPMNGFAGYMAKKIKNKPLLVDSDDLEININRFQGLWQKYIIDIFEKWITHHADHITTNTHFNVTRYLMEGISSKKITYLPNGVDFERFKHPDKDLISSLRKNLNLSRKKVIAYIGSLSIDSHPIDILINAFSKVHTIDPDTVLLIVGGGESYNYLRNYSASLDIGSHIIFTGRVSPDKIVLYYFISDITVDPIYDDDTAKSRSPLKLFESWACRKPFITGDVGDRRKIIGEPPAGLLIKAGDPDSLANAILKLLRSPEMVKEIIEQSDIRAKIYSWENHAEKLVDLYNSILGIEN